MLSALRREIIQFGRSFWAALTESIEVWKRCGGKFKTICVWIALFIVVFLLTELARSFAGEQTLPRYWDLILTFASMHIAAFIGRKRGWLPAVNGKKRE